MSNRNIFILILIFQLLLSSKIVCKHLCYTLKFSDEKHIIDSALSLDDKVYLFKNKVIWLFDPKLNSEPISIGKIHENFESIAVDSEYKTNLKKIDAITQLPNYQKGSQSEDKQRLIFVIYERKYWFFMFDNCTEQNRRGKCFKDLQPKYKKYIPTKMEYSSGPLFDWFPNDYDDLLALDHYLFIFYNRSAQVVKLPNNMSDNWDNDPGIISFGGDMKSVEKIDGVFEMPLSEDIVFINSNKYCRFNRNHLLSAVYIQSVLEISCQWSALSAIFNCRNRLKYSSSEKPITNDSEFNRSTTEQPGDPVHVSTNSLIIIMVIVIVVIFIVMAFVLVLFSTFVRFNEQEKSSSVRTNITNVKSKSDPETWSSIVTLDSNSERNS